MYVPLKALVVGTLLLALIASAHLLLPVLLVLLAFGLACRIGSGLFGRQGHPEDGFRRRRTGVDPWSGFVPTIDGEPLRSAFPTRSRAHARPADFA